MATYAKEKGFTVQTLSTDTAASQVAGGSWASGGNMNTAREEGGGAGTQTAGLAFGGNTGSDSALNESYNGSSWTEVADLNDARKNASGFGTQTAALLAGGNPNSANTETWDNSSWTEVGDLNTGRENILNAGAGTTTAGLVWGGYDDPAGTGRDITESWNGSAWTEVGDLNSERYDCSGNGTSTAALAVSGTDGAAPVSSVESWNGSAWTEVAEANTPRSGTTSTGTYTSLILVGGATNTATVANTEYYDGSSWTEVSDISTATRDQMPSKAGTSSLAFVAGGSQPTRVATTEEWTAPSTFTKIQEGQLFFNSTSNAFKVTEFDIAEATWSSGGSLNDGRTSFTGIGVQTAVVAASGQDGSTSLIDSVEEYNGTAWTEVNDTPVTLKYFAAGGILTAGWVAAGVSAWNAASFNAETYHYDGTNWTDSGNVNTNRYVGYGGGPQTAAFFAAGNNTSFAAVANHEQYNGSSWTETTDLNTARNNTFGNGTQVDGIIAGGSPGYLGNTEVWNGSTWTETTDLNTARAVPGAGGGTAPGSSVLVAGGATSPGNQNNVEAWNGSTWTEINNLAATNSSNALGISNATSAITFGGFAPSPSTFATVTEEFTADLVNFTITSS